MTADPDPRHKLTQNMQERQTQVLALPAKAEGRDRDTEGISKSLWNLPDLRAKIHKDPRCWWRFHAGFGDTDPFQTC